MPANPLTLAHEAISKLCSMHGKKSQCGACKEAHAALDAACKDAKRETLESVRTYHRSGGEIHETWLHKQIRKVKGAPDAG